MPPIAEFLIRRFAHSILVLLGVLILVFVVGHSIGDPARLMLPLGAPEARYEEVRHALGLDQPVLTQFAQTVSGWVQGDFGQSLWQRVPALPLALGRLPATLYLSLITLAIAIPVAVLLGILAASRPGTSLDRGVGGLSILSISVADFWLALVLILLFASTLHVLPTSGFGGLDHAILPAVTLALPIIGRLSQILRTSMREELEAPYVVTARSHGLSQAQIIRRHVLRNAAIPALTLGGAEAIALLNGAIVVETIFAWPGIGKLLIDAIHRRDLPLIESCVFVITILVVMANLLVDLTYARLDPRVSR